MTRATPLKRSPMKPGRVAKARKPVWKARTEIRKLDAFCRQIVLARDRHTCRRCGKSKEQAQIHWAHVISRSKKSVRWDLNNSMALCYFCHFRWAHEQPLAYAAFVREQIGDEAADLLTLRGNCPISLSPANCHAIWAYLSDEAQKYGVKL